MMERVLNKRVSGMVWICGSIAFASVSFALRVSVWQGLAVLFCVCGATILPGIAMLKGDPLAVWVVRLEAGLVMLLLTWWVWHRNWFIDLATLLAIGGSVWVLLGLSYKSHDRTS
jgi:hypothetical protein